MNKKINTKGKKIKTNKKGKNTNEAHKEYDLVEENINLNNYNNLNFLSKFQNSSKVNTQYRNQLDERMDLLMKKIDQNINNNNYKQLNMIIHNPKINYINNYNNNPIPEKIESEEEEKEDDENNMENNIKEKVEDQISENAENVNKSNTTKFEIQGNIKENEINTKILKRNKFLENEINYLKYKLDKVEKQKEFVQNIIKNDNNIRRHLFDIFTVDYFKKIALNWKEVSNELIDELIIDEIHELTNVKLKLRHNKRLEKEKEEKSNEVKEISSFDIEQFNLFNDNIRGIKETIKSVKESERNLCKKYKVKING